MQCLLILALLVAGARATPPPLECGSIHGISCAALGFTLLGVFAACLFLCCLVSMILYCARPPNAPPLFAPRYATYASSSPYSAPYSAPYAQSTYGPVSGYSPSSGAPPLNAELLIPPSLKHKR